MTKKALLVIDAQNGVLLGERPCHEVNEVLGRIAALLAKARAEGVPIFFVQDDTVGEPGSEDLTIHAAIAPAPGEPVVHKRACDSFHRTNLHELLQEQQINHLVVAGAMTDYCVDSAIRRATTLGYDVTLVSDAHTTCDTSVLPAASVIAHANRIFAWFDNLENRTYTCPAAEISFQ